MAEKLNHRPCSSMKCLPVSFSQALYAVAKLGVADFIRHGRSSIAELALAAGADEGVLYESCEHWQVSACCMRKKAGFSPSHLPGSCFAATIRNRCAMRL